MTPPLSLPCRFLDQGGVDKTERGFFALSQRVYGKRQPLVIACLALPFFLLFFFDFVRSRFVWLEAENHRVGSPVDCLGFVAHVRGLRCFFGLRVEAVISIWPLRC